MRINSHFDLGMEKVHFPRDKKSGAYREFKCLQFPKCTSVQFYFHIFSKHFFYPPSADVRAACL